MCADEFILRYQKADVKFIYYITERVNEAGYKCEIMKPAVDNSGRQA